MALKPFLGGEPAEIKILLHAESGMTTYKLTAARLLSGVCIGTRKGNKKMKCFHPEGIYVWDTWYYEYNGEVHCTFLQQARPGHPERKGENGALGHAVSRDLIHWEARPSILYPGEKGTYDDGELWTGCTYLDGSRRYMYYAANHPTDTICDASIGLAVSDDGEHYERHPESPVITCDPRYYVTPDKPLKVFGHGHGHVDCRDLCVVKDPDGRGYWGYFAARIDADECARTSVIALAHSDDLVHWEQLPPCFTPNRYGCVEVPDVFYLDGKWWMLCLTGNMYGQRNRTGQPDWSLATIQAVADRPEGPFTEVYGHEVLGSVNWQGFSSKTLLWNGSRYMFHTQGEDPCGSHFGTISFPAELKRTGDHLSPMWCMPLEKMKKEKLLSPAEEGVPENDGRWGSIGDWHLSDRTIVGSCECDWSMRLYDGNYKNFIFEGDVTLRGAESAGLVIRAEGEDNRGGAYVILLDAVREELWFTMTREFPVIDRKKIPVKQDKKYNIKIIALWKCIPCFRR